MRTPLWPVIGLIVVSIVVAAALVLLAVYVHWAVGIVAASVLGVIISFPFRLRPGTRWLAPGTRRIMLLLILLASVCVIVVVTVVREGSAGSPIEQAVREQFRGGAFGTDRPSRVSCTPTGDQYVRADVYWCETSFSGFFEGTWPVCAALIEQPLPGIERQLVLAAGEQGFLDLRGDPLSRHECTPGLLALEHLGVETPR